MKTHRPRYPRYLQDQFDLDIAQHELEIIRDDGLYRHLRCSRPGTGIYRFDVVTWPGHLAYTGDMGTFVFSRTADMFKFFRSDCEANRINPGYWSQKVLSEDRVAGIEEFSEHRMRDAIASVARDLRRREASNEVVRSWIDATQDCASSEDWIDAASRFAEESPGAGDWWDYDTKDYTHHFLWCCHALLWAIKAYDQVKQSSATVAGGAA